MNAIDYQRAIESALRRYFNEVQLEWPVVKGADDAFTTDLERYAPRVDVAVGPFSVTPGPVTSICDALLPAQLLDKFADRRKNDNPRCLLAIEVVHSGTSKHIMGDMLNASSLGLYGVIVGEQSQMPKIRRVRRYLDAIAELKKQPYLFPNIILTSGDEFHSLLAAK